MSEPTAPPPADPEPVSDDNTFEVSDEALSTLAQRRGLSLGDEHATIGLLASLIEQAQRCLPENVTNARLNGTSWERIAHLLGTSAHEAELRFDPNSPIADNRWPYNY